MGDSFFGNQKWYWYILNLLYCLVPAVVMFLINALFDTTWIALIIIHLGVMVLIPYLLLRVIRLRCLDVSSLNFSTQTPTWAGDTVDGIMMISRD